MSARDGIEVQVISRLFDPKSDDEVERLCEYDESYYGVFRSQIHFILEHKAETGQIPDKFTFQMEFQDFIFVAVNESIDYLIARLIDNKCKLLIIETFDKLKDLGSDDIQDAWKYVRSRCELVDSLRPSSSLDLVKQASKRAKEVEERSKQARISTGFDEIDKAMYGGLSTVEELAIILARTNTGKSWVATKMMETAQKNGFPVLYYSPEMQGSYLATRFDTWRGHFENSKLFQGKYSDEYMDYIKALEGDKTSAYILEDKDAPDGEVTVPYLKNLVKRDGIKLLIIDGLSYMEDARAKKMDTDYVKFKNLCQDLFALSKSCGCAVVVMMQANRASKDNKDDKGDVFPNIYNIEGSDHPARIATQVFALRQIYEKHILDIRLEKSRNSNNQKPTFSYSWDINTGKCQFVNSPESGATVAPTTPIIPQTMSPQTTTNNLDAYESGEDIEF